MKAKSRFLGIDDAPFRFSDETVPVVGVVVQAPSYIEGVLTTLAEVDGHDATERIASMVRRSRYRAGLAAILIDGTAVGGFNVIDIDAVRAAVDRPVVTVTRKKPNLGSIETALRRRFDDWQERLATIRRHEIEAIRTGHGSVWVTYVGASRTEVQEALSLTTVRGVLPEPLRVAHLIAAGIVPGETPGPALLRSTADLPLDGESEGGGDPAPRLELLARLVLAAHHDDGPPRGPGRTHQG